MKQTNTLRTKRAGQCIEFKNQRNFAATPIAIAHTMKAFEGVSKLFWTDSVKIINLTTKRVWKLPTSTQLRATSHTNSLDMVVLPYTGASRYHNCCIDGGTSSEFCGFTPVPECINNIPDWLCKNHKANH
jgi:hypothetical protein